MFRQIRLPKCLFCIRTVWINGSGIIFRVGYGGLKELMWKWLALCSLYLGSRHAICENEKSGVATPGERALSSCKPVSAYVGGKFLKDGKMYLLGNLIFLKTPKEKLPVRREQPKSHWGWSGFNPGPTTSYWHCTNYSTSSSFCSRSSVNVRTVTVRPSQGS